MNEYERRNLDFIMSMTDEEFDEFFADMPQDDIDYALELIQLGKTDLAMQEYALLDEETADLSEARSVLARIMAL